VVLTAFPPAALTERIAKRSPAAGPVIELDVTSPLPRSLKDRVRTHVDGRDAWSLDREAPRRPRSRQLSSHRVGGRGEGRASVDLLAEVTRDVGAAADGRTCGIGSGLDFDDVRRLARLLTGWACPRPFFGFLRPLPPRTWAPQKVRVNLGAAARSRHGGQFHTRREKFRGRVVAARTTALAGTSPNPEGRGARLLCAAFRLVSPRPPGRSCNVDAGCTRVGV